MFKWTYVIISVALVAFYFLLPALSQQLHLVTFHDTSWEMALLSLRTEFHLLRVLTWFAPLIIFVAMAIAGVASKETAPRQTLAGLAVANLFFCFLNVSYSGIAFVGIGIWVMGVLSLAALVVASLEQKNQVNEINSPDHRPYLDDANQGAMVMAQPPLTPPQEQVEDDDCDDDCDDMSDSCDSFDSSDYSSCD